MQPRRRGLERQDRNAWGYLQRCRNGEDRPAAPPISLTRHLVVLGRGMEPPPGTAQSLTGVPCPIQWVSTDDERVSRVHASIKIRWEQSGWRPLVSLEDYSRNGTFLNGIPLQPGRQTTLANGDRISLVLSINPLAEVSYVYEEASLMALMSVDRPEECELFNDSCGGSSPLKSSLPRPRPPLSYIDGDACQGQVKVLLRPCTSSLPCNVQRAVSAEAGLAAVAAAGPSSPHPLHPQQPSVPLAHLRSPDRRRLSRTASSTAGFGGHSGGGGSVAVGTVRRRPRHVPPTEPMGCRTVDGGGGDGNDFIGPMKHGIGGSSDDAVVSPTSTPHRRCCTAPGRGYPISHVRSGGVAAVTASASTSAAARGAADFGRRDGTVPGAVSAGLAHRTDRTTANRATAWDAFAFMEAEAFAARDVALIRWPSSVPSPPGIEPGSINTAMPPPGAASVFAPDRRLRCAHSPIQSCPLPQTSSPASPPACPRQPIGRALPPPVPQPSLSPSPADAAATAGGSCGGSMRSGAGSGAGRPRWRPSRLLHSSSPGSLLSDMKGTAAEHDATPPATGQKLQRPSPPPQSSARDAVAANVQEDDAPGMAAAKLVAALAVEPRRGRRRNTRTGADGEDGCEAAGGGGESSQTTSEDDAHSFSFSIAWRPRVSPPPTPPPSSCGDAAAAAAGGSPHWADVRESICSAAGEVCADRGGGGSSTDNNISSTSEMSDSVATGAATVVTQGPGPGLLRGRFTQAAGASGCDRGDEKGISASAAAAAAAATAAVGSDSSFSWPAAAAATVAPPPLGRELFGSGESQSPDCSPESHSRSCSGKPPEQVRQIRQPNRRQTLYGESIDTPSSFSPQSVSLRQLRYTWEVAGAAAHNGCSGGDADGAAAVLCTSAACSSHGLSRQGPASESPSRARPFLGMSRTSTELRNSAIAAVGGGTAAAASTDTGSICPYLPYTPITLRQRLLSSCYRDAHTTGVEGSGVRSVCDSNDNYGSGGSDRDGSGNPHSAQGSSRTSAGNWSNQCCGDSWMDISVDGCGRGTASGNDGGGDDAPVSSSYSCVSGAHPTGNAAVVVGAANAASAASAAARRRYSSPDSEESVYDNLRSGIYCGRDTVEGVLGDHHRDRPSVAAVMVDRTPDVIRRRRAVALGSYESMTLGNDPQSVPRRARCHILSPSAANPGAFLPSLALRTNLTPAAVASTHATPGTDDDDDVDDDNGYDGAVTAAATCVASRLVQQRHQQQLREALDSPQPPSPPSPPSLSFVMPPPTSSGVAVRPSPALAMQHLMTCSGSDALDPVVPGTCRYSPRCGPEALLCGLCGDYLQRAIAVHPCGHTYCGSCLSEHLSSLMAAGCRLGCPEGCTVFTHLAANQPARRLEEILVGPRHNDGGCEQERIGTGSSGGVAGATAAAAMALPLGGGGLAATALTPGAAGNLAALNPGPRDSGGSGTADAVAAGASNAGAETPARFQTTTADIGGVQGPSSAVPRARPERMQHEDSPAPHHRNLTGRHNAVPSPSQSPLQRCLLYTPAGRFPQTESTTTATAASDASSTAGSYGGEDGGGDGDGARIGERRTRHRRDGDAAGGILHDMGALGRTVDGGVSELCPLPDGILPLPAVRLHLRQAEHLLLRLRGVMGLRPEAAPNAGAVPDADDVAAARCLELLCPLTRLATTQPEAREALSAMGAIQGCLLVMEQQQRIQLQRDRQHLLEQLNRHRQRQHLPQQQRQQHHHQQPMPSSHGGRCNCHPNCNSCYCSTDRLDVDPEPLRNPCNGDQSNDGNADVGAGAGGGMSFHCDELDISDRNLDPAGRHNVVTTAAVASTTRNNGQGGSSSGGPRMTASSPFPRASASSPSPSYDDGASTWHSSFTAAADHVVVPCSGTAATPAAAVSAHRESWGPAPAQTLLAKGSTAAAPTDDLAVCRQSLMAQRAACGLLVALLTAVGPDDGCQQSNQWYMARLGAVDVLLRLLRRAADTVAAMETAAAAAAAEAETKTEAVNLTLVRERRTYGEGQGVLDHLRQVQRRQCWQQLQLEDEADFLAIAVLTVLRLMVAENTMTQAHLACDGTAAVLGLLRDMPRSVGVQTAGLQLVAQMAQGDDVTHTAIRHCLVEKGAVQLAVAALGGCGDAVCGGSGRRGVGAGNAAAYHSQCQSQGSSVGDERVTGRAGGGSSGGGARGPLSAAALAALKALLTAPIPDLLRKALASELRRVGALARIRSSLREFEAEVVGSKALVGSRGTGRRSRHLSPPEPPTEEDRWLLTTARRLEKQIVEVMAANHWWRWRRSSVACGSGGGGGGSWELSWGLLAAAAGVGFALGASASAVVVGAFLV